MAVETFRYLFSALIQVFGTIIAINAIFLIFKHEFNLKRLEILKKILAIDTLSYGHGVLDYRKDFGPLEAYDRPATYICTYTEDKFMCHIRTIKNNISSSIMSLEVDLDKEGKSKEWRQREQNKIKEHKELLEMIESREEQYLNLLNDIKNFFKLLMKVMSVPAILAILFSLGLLFTEKIDGIGSLIPVAIIAILLSAIGFAVIISLAAKTFRE